MGSLTQAELTILENLLEEVQDKELAAKALSGDPDYRSRLRTAARKLTAALEAPDDPLIYAQFWPQIFMCVRVAIDLRLFHILHKHKDAISASQLAEASGAEEQLLIRLLRGLTYGGFVTEVKAQIYQSNLATENMTKPSVEAGVRHWYDIALLSFYKIPEYLKANNYRSPPDAHSGPLQYAFNTNLESYTYWKTQPGVTENFNVFMSGKFTSEDYSQSWLDYCNIHDELVEKHKAGTALFVDIGGSYGKVVQAFKRKYPSAQGKFVLQDLPDVIDDIKELDADIDRVKYDFFEPQPVVGARSYFFANVLHNWSDNDCQKILANVVKAMETNYSVLLLNEGIMPEKDVPLTMIGRDLGMMALHSAVERSENQWKSMLEKAGLRVGRVWYSGLGEGVIEAVLA